MNVKLSGELNDEKRREYDTAAIAKEREDYDVTETEKIGINGEENDATMTKESEIIQTLMKEEDELDSESENEKEMKVMEYQHDNRRAERKRKNDTRRILMEKMIIMGWSGELFDKRNGTYTTCEKEYDEKDYYTVETE
eukprot:scaffold8776_cov78-Cylindrotheca_fusiformis.AAC.2